MARKYNSGEENQNLSLTRWNELMT